jgi:hypothetical protein
VTGNASACEEILVLGMGNVSKGKDVKRFRCVSAGIGNSGFDEVLFFKLSSEKTNGTASDDGADASDGGVNFLNFNNSVISF